MQLILKAYEEHQWITQSLCASWTATDMNVDISEVIYQGRIGKYRIVISRVYIELQQGNNMTSMKNLAPFWSKQKCKIIHTLTTSAVILTESD